MIVAEARYCWWNKYFGSPITYAEALWFTHINKSFASFLDLKSHCLTGLHNRFTGKFQEVLNTAIYRSYAKAYEVLIS